MEGGGKLKTMSGDMEKRLLSQDLLKEASSDEDGGDRARVEMDSDFSIEEEEEGDVPVQAKDPDPFEGRENWSELLTKRRSKHNTGPKGVKADYMEAQAIMRRRNETKRLQEMEAFKRAGGVTTNKESISYNSTKLLLRQLKKDEGSDADDEDDGDDSDGFLRAYRAKRLAEVNSLSQLPRFGKVIPVDKFQFLDETDNADPRTFVVTHLFEDYLESCRKMNLVLDQLAQRQPHIKILKLKATEASQTLSHRALPAFLVYKNKEIVNDSSIAVDAKQFENGVFGVSDMEFFFSSRYGIDMQGVDVSAEERRKELQALEVSEQEPGEKWQSHQSQTLGRVNLLSNRVSKLSMQNDANDDDDW